MIQAKLENTKEGKSRIDEFEIINNFTKIFRRCKCEKYLIERRSNLQKLPDH